MVLRIPHEGFDDYVKGQWLREFGLDSLRRVSEDPEADFVGDISTGTMGAINRVLHSFVLGNFTPREQKRTTILIQDVLIMDKLILHERVNLPKIIMQHMAHARKNDKNGLPFPSIVKKILIYQQVYIPGKKDLVFARDLEESNLRKMKFERNAIGKWEKISIPLDDATSSDDNHEEKNEEPNRVYKSEGLGAIYDLVSCLSEQQRRLVSQIFAMEKELHRLSLVIDKSVN